MDNTKPELKLIKCLWGVPESFNRAKWSQLFTRIKNEGFVGIEVFPP